jgi:predicted RNA-binding Zn ribbon-like protein
LEILNNIEPQTVDRRHHPKDSGCTGRHLSTGVRQLAAVSMSLRAAMTQGSHTLAVTINRLCTLRSLTVRLAQNESGSWEQRIVASSEDRTSRLAAAIVAPLAAILVSGQLSRVKACRVDACGRIFYDGSKNQSGLYCRGQGCAERIHAREHRRRKRLLETKTERSKGTLDQSLSIRVSQPLPRWTRCK